MNVTLVKYKQMYIPLDSVSYRVLRAHLNIANTQIHEDMIPLLKQQCAKKGIKLIGRHFDVVYDKFVDKLLESWCITHRSANMSEGNTIRGRWVFRANKTAYKKARKTGVIKLEKAIRKFFNRWGITGNFVFTENEGSSLKLVVDYTRENRLPIISLKKQASESCSLIMGRTKINIVRDGKWLHFEVYEQAGGEYNTAPTMKRKCLVTEVSDPTHMVGMLVDCYSTEDL